MSGLAELIEAARAGPQMDGWSGPFVEQTIAGTADPADLALLVEEWVWRNFATGVERALWYHASVGMVAGVRLADGREVVVKAYQPRYASAFLSAFVAVQRHLAHCWYPVAVPLVGPTPFGLGQATADVMLADPGPSTDRDLVSSAAGLARLVRYAAGVAAPGLAPHPLQVSMDALYPAPHAPVFDFVRTVAGAAWIDELAAVAAAARQADDTRPVIGHGDWSARNVRFDRNGVQAVFDLDSLTLTPDAFVAGQAAVMWATTMDDGEPDLPDPGAIGMFLDVYQQIRGYRFRLQAQRAAWGSALWVLAYTARCEHALGLTGRASDGLRRYGDELARRAEGPSSA